MTKQDEFPKIGYPVTNEATGVLKTSASDPVALLERGGFHGQKQKIVVSRKTVIKSG